MAMVEIRPIDSKKWHDKKGKESFTQPKVVEVLYDKSTGRYATGLTEEEAAEYGKRLGVDLSDNFSYDKPHPFWSTKAAEIRLENNTMIFNMDNPAHFVKVKNMKASKQVANSVKEYEDGLFPDATHVIFDESEEIDLKASKIKLKEKATIVASKMSKDEKINIIQILSQKSLRGRSDNFISVEMDTILEEQATDFLRYATMDKQEVYVRAAILECIHRNILTKEGSAVYYMGEQIGMDYESAVSWFKDPQNSKMKVAILEKINN